MTEVAVVGAGVAGGLAALAAAAAGARVTVLSAGGGATAMSSGVWDGAGTERLGLSELRSLPSVLVSAERLLALTWAAERLGLALHETGPLPLLCTTAGRLRRAAAHDPAQLDLSRSPRAIVAVASLRGHPSFDAERLAAALDDEAVAAGDARRFVAVEIDFVRRGRDRVLHPHELASVLEPEGDARTALVRAIGRGLGGLSVDAILLPPLLGLRVPVRAELSRALGLPIGEVVEGIDSAAGLRLSFSIERALAAAKIPRRSDKVHAIEARSGRLRVAHDAGVLEVDRVVLATGKRLGGGVTDDASGPRETVLGLTRELVADRTGQLAGAPPGVSACGELLTAIDARSGLVEVAVSALRAGLNAAT